MSYSQSLLQFHPVLQNSLKNAGIPVLGSYPSFCSHFLGLHAKRCHPWTDTLYSTLRESWWLCWQRLMQTILHFLFSSMNEILMMVGKLFSCVSEAKAFSVGYDMVTVAAPRHCFLNPIWFDIFKKKRIPILICVGADRLAGLNYILSRVGGNWSSLWGEGMLVPFPQGKHQVALWGCPDLCRQNHRSIWIWPNGLI